MKITNTDLFQETIKTIEELNSLNDLNEFNPNVFYNNHSYNLNLNEKEIKIIDEKNNELIIDLKNLKNNFNQIKNLIKEKKNKLKSDSVYEIQKKFLNYLINNLIIINPYNDFHEITVQDQNEKISTFNFEMIKTPSFTRHNNDIVIYHKNMPCVYLRHSFQNYKKYINYNEIEINDETINLTIEKNNGILYCVSFDFDKKDLYLFV